MSAPERVHYKKLPGRRRGIINGASVWQGPDHLLLVRSWRIREQYKRYYLGDIQSIAVAEAPRFHISTRSIGIGILWLIAYSIAAGSHVAWEKDVLWVIAAALVVAWIYISAKCSCICRIYTAVSGDDLPSVYRTWTARRFMEIVEQHIRAAQGSMEGEWADDVEARRIGPPEEGHAANAFGAATTPSAIAAQQNHERPLLLPVLFVVAMFVDAVVDYLLGQHRTVALTRLGWGIAAVNIGLYIALVILHQRGRLLAGMQKLLIASILVTGLTLYGGTVIQAVFIAGVAARSPGRVVRPAPAPVTSVVGTFGACTHLVWGIWGLGILLTQQQRKPRAMMTE